MKYSNILIPLFVINPLLIFLFPFGLQALGDQFVYFAFLSPLISFLLWDFLIRPLVVKR
ncbi:hypothetical protein [Rhizobium sp.]|uniref:hypothetical protein n=1 Tax=Rhizobium sp. TaxID=391 RepID=UPI0028A75748